MIRSITVPAATVSDLATKGFLSMTLVEYLVLRYFTFDITVAFPLTQQGRPSQRTDFGAQYTA